MSDGASVNRIEEAIWRVMEWLESDEERMEQYEGFLDTFYGTFPEDAYPVPIEKMLDRIPESIEAWFVGMTLEEFIAAEDPSIPRQFLSEAAGVLSAGEAAYIESLSASVLSFYEVVDAVPGESLTLQDLVRGGDPITILDPYSSELYHRWNVVGGRVVTMDGRPYMTAFSVPLDRSRIEKLTLVLQKTFAERLVALPDSSPADPLVQEAVWLDVLDGAAAFAALSFVMQAYSETKLAERERYVEFRYNLRVPPDQVAAKLNAHPEFEPSQTDVWILKGAKPTDPPQGWIVIDGTDLSVEGESIKRCKAISAKLEKDLKLNLGKAERIEHDPANEDDDLSEMQEAELRAIPDLLAAAVDTPMEELDGKTPREMIRTDEGRLAVVSLLKETERALNEQLGPDRPPIDLSAVWPRFGLIYPSGERLPAG